MNDQILLLTEESDEALLLPPVERRKRYTAAQVQKIEWREECILVMIAAQVIPLDRIAEAAHVNLRTIKIMAARDAERIGRDTVKFGEYSAGLSASFLHKAEMKSDAATFKDLMIGHGIARDTALAMRAAGAAAGDPNADAINVETVDEDLRKFREGLKQLKPVTQTPAE